MTNRRDFLRISAAAGLAAHPIFSIAQSDELVLACPTAMSGTFSAIGKYSELGMKLAVEQQGTVLGKKLGYRMLDTEAKPATAVRRVQEAMEQRHINMFTGALLSAESLAMSKEIDKAGGLLITNGGADELTGSDCNRSTFRWALPTYSLIQGSARPLIDLMPQAKRWYTITPQYVFGEGLLRNAKALFKEKGIEHVGNSYHSLTEREYSGYLTNAMASKADVLFLLNYGAQASDTLRQAISFGLKQKMTIIVAAASGLEQFEGLGADICEDVYFGAVYWHTIDTAYNKRFVGQVRDKFNISPNYSLAAPYVNTRMLIDGINKAKSTEPAAVIAALEGMQFDGVTGTEEVRKEDHQVLRDFYLIKGKAKAKMKDKDDYADIINSGRFFLSPEQAGCKMA
ncbi:MULTISPECIES: ABC transporter substrate-binding protein [unclassified Achromobacter]|uniref:ABC transporter substrate-binding protein n=1 Tax=unclassified Achromobacter TaxID=2626865 RepID=UPI000B51558B|nr:MULTISPECIES: ABC transporter substrate-binding protein [unclassified Achromobacter]OWT80859.1 branched-chain amino acid ABC transporter substrate-binding protein [Achromobacter sp. HZ34]OWT81375.1 branched-chain amino acid ABC transporter substrate-binding protein [Achromobacter sp. HZ28]